MNEKTVNYTPEMVAQLHAGYDGTASDVDRKAQVRALARELGKSEGSVRAKLTHEGIYVTLTKAPSGKNTIRKAALVTAIAGQIGVDEDVIGSLEKATKNTLIVVFKALTAE